MLKIFFKIQLMILYMLMIYSWSFSQSGSFNKQKTQLQFNLIEKQKSIYDEHEKNTVATYFKGIALDVVNDGVHSVTDVPAVFKNMFTIPFEKQNRLSSSISLGFLGCSFLLDEQANEFFENKWEPYCSKYVPSKKFPLPIFVPTQQVDHFYIGGFIAIAEYSYGYGILFRNNSVRTLGYNLMKATAYSFIIAQSLKAITGRARPKRKDNPYFEEHNPWEWGYSNMYFGGSHKAEYNSFPSFHAVFFASYWTVFMDYMGYKWLGPIVASIFYFQINSHNHWFSDMVAGGILGYWLGSSVGENSKSEKIKNKKIHYWLIPLYRGVALQFTKNL